MATKKTNKSTPQNKPISTTPPKKEFDLSNMLNFAKLSKLILRDLEKNNKTTTFFSKYTKADIIKYLKNPELNAKQLRDISIYLYNASSHYKRLILYFARMLLFYYIVVPFRIDIEKVDKNKFKNQYKKILDLLENMNLQHEFIKITTTILREDIFYGYEYSTKDSYFIQKLNPDYCQISSIEDGCFNFAFDFNYFKTYPEKLKQYGEEFEEKYNIYKANSELRWQELDSKRTICIKMSEDIEFPVPFFVGVLESLYDIEDFKALKKAKTEIGNYKMLSLQIPFDKETGDFLIDLDIAKEYYRQMGSVLPENIGLVLSPMDIKDFDFEKDKADQDNVSDAVRDYYSSAGVSDLLFNSEKSSSNSLKLSIDNDSSIMFAVLRSLERWVNRKIKQESGVIKFKCLFLDITKYNQKEFYENCLKGSQASLPMKTMSCVSMGISQSDMTGLNFLETEILEIQDKFIPLQSSHTQSADDGGRPSNSDKDLPVEKGTEEQQENGSNEDR